jgi:excisionase family DNA binding protein
MAPKRKVKRSSVQYHCPEILNVEAAAKLLNVSIRTMRHIFASKQIPNRKVGKRFLTSKSAVLKWLVDGDGNNDDLLIRSIESGDKKAITDLLKPGVKVKAGK